MATTRILRALATGGALALFGWGAAGAQLPPTTVAPVTAAPLASGLVLVTPSTETTSIGFPIAYVSYRTQVYFADLDLGTRSGVDALKLRLERSAEFGCAQLSNRFVVSDSDGACRARAVADALGTLGLSAR